MNLVISGTNAMQKHLTGLPWVLDKLKVTLKQPPVLQTHNHKAFFLSKDVKVSKKLNKKKCTLSEHQYKSKNSIVQ